jgi:phage shock protein PspC (stress-responsive transcriptional regulator)
MTVVPLDLLLGSRVLVRLLYAMTIVFTALMPGLLGYQTFLLAQRRD